MTTQRRLERHSLTNLIRQVDFARRMSSTGARPSIASARSSSQSSSISPEKNTTGYPASMRPTQDEDSAAALRALKAMALERQVACLVVSHLARRERDRSDHRPGLEDFGVLGAVKQHADIVLGIYREEMYNPGAGVEGATELVISKNRNGPTGFVDLYFYRQWMRFEDMLDPDR